MKIHKGIKKKNGNPIGFMAFYLTFYHISKNSLNTLITASNTMLGGWTTMHLTVVQIWLLSPSCYK